MGGMHENNSRDCFVLAVVLGKRKHGKRALVLLWHQTAMTPLWHAVVSVEDTCQGNGSLVAGDTLYIRAGTYSERIIPQNSGVAEGPSCIDRIPANSCSCRGTPTI